MSLNEKVPEQPEPNPYDPARFRLDQDYDDVEVEPVIVSIPVRRPTKQEFIRVHPDDEFQMPAGLVEFEGDRQFYLVAPGLRDAVAAHCSPVRLYTAINRAGELFLWPAKLPRPGAPVLEWHQSAHRAAELAGSRWVQMRANMSRRAYDLLVASADLPDPGWPEISFEEVFQLAFEGRLIDSLDHPVVRQLEGRE